ncbi:MAG: Asp-tRNA(Asn)/Glu-tRNA(Gln) amidotransferase subunit GatC [Candidatus Omnitrophota bacterium]
MAISKEQVQHVALLSRLSLSDEELELYRKQLGSIIEYIDTLNKLDTDGVQPTSHPLSSMKNVFRDDELKPSLSVEDALKNAPEREGDFFKIPKVIEDT